MIFTVSYVYVGVGCFFKFGGEVFLRKYDTKTHHDCITFHTTHAGKKDLASVETN